MTATSKPITADEPALWQGRLAVLKAGLDMGDAATEPQIKAEIQRLGTDIATLSNRREVVLRTDMNAGQLSPQAARLTKDMDERAAKVDDLRKLLKAAKRIPADKVQGETPEVKARPARMDPIILLEEAERKEAGKGLTHDQARAAKEIARIMEAVSRAGQAKAAQMQNNGSGRGQGFRDPEMPVQLSEIHATRFLPWADYLNDHEPVILDICIKVSFMGISLKMLAAKHRMRRDNALKGLRSGLDRYWNERVLLPLYAEKQRRNKEEFDRVRFSVDCTGNRNV